MSEEKEEKSDKQNINRPWLFQKGQSGNPKGRPKGKTLKEYCRDFLSKQTGEERMEFLNGLSKDIIWRMAEGNPKQDTDITSGGKEMPTPIINVLQHHSNQKDNKSETED